MISKMELALLIIVFLISQVYGLQNDSITETTNQTDTSCQALHSRAPGLNLVCCNKLYGLSPDCQFRRLCNLDRCSCTLTMMPEFTCKYQTKINSSVIWEDHKPPSIDPLPCLVNMPNPTADYSILIQKWSQNYSMLLLMTLQKHNVVALDIDLGAPIDSVNLANLDVMLPNLERLTIRANPTQRGLLIDSNFLGRFPKLKFLKLTNVDFKFPETKADWTSTVEKIQIDSSSLRSLPRWLSSCNRLTNLLLRNTLVDSIMTISQMSSLVFVYVDSNQFNDLEKVSFSSQYVEVLDLSNNKIVNFSAHTFAQLKSLRFLDLNSNPISTLPLRGFVGNGQLKYLYLNKMKLEDLSPEHFAGLHTLKLLSLSENPLQNIDPFAFLPIRMIRTLEMNDCNLTSIPLAVTQCCLLNSLSLSGNLFYERNSMSIEILALISHVENLNFGRNPLIQLPYGLFLLERTKHELMKNLVDTLTQLPVFHYEPCTPYMWFIHLKESPPNVRKRVALWNSNRMKLEKLSHCQQLYESIMGSLVMYRGLKEQSGCEMTRKYRSIRSHCKSQSPNASFRRISTNNCTANNPTATSLNQIRIDHVTRIITLCSLGLNLTFLMIVVVRLLVSITSFSNKTNDPIDTSLQIENKRRSTALSADHEETRRALLQAFELSRQ